MKTFEYHQFLKYIYFEGYADSYEGAENLIEELDNEEIDDLYEKFVRAMDTRGRGPDHRTTFPRFRNRGDEFDPKFTRTRVGRKQDGENVDPYYKGRKKRKEIRRTGVGGRSFTNGSDDEDVNEDLEIHNIIIDYLLDEGYTDTLESAEIIIENMSEKWLYDIIEDFIPENVSGGRARRASSRRAPIPQRVTSTQANEIRANARNNPRPSPAEPTDNSLAAMRARFKEAEAAESAKNVPQPRGLPSGGIGASARVLRGPKKRTPGGMAQARVAYLHPSNTTSQQQADRREKIRAALKNRKNWGKPKARNGEENL